MKTYEIQVRRDSMMVTPVIIPAHETAVLAEIFGTENILNADGQRVDIDGYGEPVGEFNPADEYTRLCSKYSPVIVEKALGKRSAFVLPKEPEAEASESKPTARRTVARG